MNYEINRRNIKTHYFILKNLNEIIKYLFNIKISNILLSSFYKKIHKLFNYFKIPSSNNK